MSEKTVLQPMVLPFAIGERRASELKRQMMYSLPTVAVARWWLGHFG